MDNKSTKGQHDKSQGQDKDGHDRPNKPHGHHHHKHGRAHHDKDKLPKPDSNWKWQGTKKVDTSSFVKDIHLPRRRQSGSSYSSGSSSYSSRSASPLPSARGSVRGAVSEPISRSSDPKETERGSKDAATTASDTHLVSGDKQGHLAKFGATIIRASQDSNSTRSSEQKEAVGLGPSSQKTGDTRGAETVGAVGRSSEPKESERGSKDAASAASDSRIAAGNKQGPGAEFRMTIERSSLDSKTPGSFEPKEAVGLGSTSQKTGATQEGPGSLRRAESQHAVRSSEPKDSERGSKDAATAASDSRLVTGDKQGPGAQQGPLFDSKTTGSSQPKEVNPGLGSPIQKPGDAKEGPKATVQQQQLPSSNMAASGRQDGKGISEILKPNQPLLPGSVRAPVGYSSVTKVSERGNKVGPTITASDSRLATRDVQGRGATTGKEVARLRSPTKGGPKAGMQSPQPSINKMASRWRPEPKGITASPKPMTPQPLATQKYEPDRSRRLSESSVASSAESETSDVTSGKHKTKRKRKPRPIPAINTIDLDDVSSSDEPSANLDPNKGLNILDKFPSQLNDELLFTLTQKEELVFRRSVSEMRWEEEESLAVDDELDDSDTTDMSTSGAAMLWERLGPARATPVPVISLNERKISLSHLNPLSKEDGQSGKEDEGPTATYQNVFQSTEGEDSGGSDSDPVQAIFDILDQANRNREATLEAENKKHHARSKLWRRRLVVVILLNFLMRYRKLFVTINEVVCPALIFMILTAGMVLNSSGTLQSSEAKHDTRSIDPFERVTVDSIFHAFCSNAEYCGTKNDRHYFIVYSPHNNFTDDLMHRVLGYLGLESASSVDDGNEDTVESQLIGANTSDEVERICQDHWEHKDEKMTPRAKRLLRYPMGVIFSFDKGLLKEDQLKKIEADEALPQVMEYVIRTHYSEVANTAEGFPFTEHIATDHRSSAYLHTGIVGMQMAIDFAFGKKIVEHAIRIGDTHMKIGKKDPIYVSRDSFFSNFFNEPALKQFEYPTYKGPIIRIRGWMALAMTILISYVVCDIVVTQSIVREQQMGSIELLKVHGMTTSMRWTAYLIITGILRAFTTLAMSLTIHVFFANHSVSHHSSPLFLWFFLWMHGCSVTCFNYFITTGITKPELAGLVAVCAGFLTLLTPTHLFEQGYLDRYSNLILCFLFPQWNLANGIYYYLRFELYEEGLDWYDFPVVIDTETHRIIALPLSCNIFLYSTMAYLSLTIYMDHILPREFSPKESWWYCCQSFWRKPASETTSTRPIPRSQKPTVYEPGPRDSLFGPRFRNVTLTDRNRVTVLDNISLDIYEGEVTCIVGQTGSGKSDFLNVIAGINFPSSGYVDVKGLKVQEYYDITNRHVSLCPQKELLIDTLSVEDHVRLCCMLHGAAYGKAKTQASFLLQMFGLTQMRRHNQHGLTVSDRKKLLVAMALSKSPSILLLDNPIDQLDAEASFQFWKLLQELKTERSIVVTCTTLEEAELYGDRIAVLSRGKLVCYGTPSYIKVAYGLGGIINLRKAENEVNTEEITEFMKTELAGAKPTLLETKGRSLHSDTLQYILPYGKFYSKLIESLENNMEKLKVSKVYMSQPSLWALFQQMATHPGIEKALMSHETRILKGANVNEHEGFESATRSPMPVQRVKPRLLNLNSAIILIKKKVWYYKQKHIFFLVAYLAQILLVIQMVYFARMFVTHEPEGLAKALSSRLYSNNYVIVRSADNEHSREGWAEAFRHVLKDDDENIQTQNLGYLDNIEDILATGTAATLTQYKRQTNFAFSRDKKGHIGYYASNSIHAAPIAAHIIMQSFLYMISPDPNHRYSTVVTSHPFLQYSGFPAGSTQSNSSTVLGVFLSLILSLLSAPAIRSVLIEKNSRFKTMQRMAGVSSVVYWFTHGIGDLMLNCFLALLCYGIIFVVDNVGWRQFYDDLERTILWYIFAGWLCWAAIPYSYFFCQVTNIRFSGYGGYVLVHFVLGILPKIITYQFLRLEITGFGLVLRYLLYIFPPYSVTSACIHFFHIIGDEQWCKTLDENTCEMYVNATDPNLRHQYDNDDVIKDYLNERIVYNDTFRTCCKPFCKMAGTCHSEKDFLTNYRESAIPGLQQDMHALVANGFMFWILVILMERQVISSIWRLLLSKLCGNLEKTVADRDLKTSDEPEDVKDEHLKVDYMVEIEGDVDSEVYLAQDVTKFYKYVKGLDHVFFSVPKHTVTGILGLPKSGKSTLLEILTCQMNPSAGYIYKDNDLLDHKTRKQLLRKVGYCQQNSILNPYLTGFQMMSIMGRLRGLSASECHEHVSWWLEEFGLLDVKNKKCKDYRKGQEQRLCCALALIGDTDMIIFDEPTLFMDSVEKYMFWNIISRLPAMNRTILFASADADEVQHQSSKVLLLDSGTLVAVGQLTEIFKNNNQGMTLAIRYGMQSKKYTSFQKKTKVDKLRDHIFQYLSPCSLVDEQENLLIYHLKDKNMKLSRVYAVMEGAKVRFTTLLERFQVSEPSLDAIIIQFHNARNKRQDKQEKQSAATPEEKATAASDSQKPQTPLN